MSHLQPLFSVPMADGRMFPAVQAVQNSVVGSPFSVSNAGVTNTPKLTGLALIAGTGNFRYAVGANATANDLIIPSGTLIYVPVNNQIISFLGLVAGPISVYVNMAKTIVDE